MLLIWVLTCVLPLPCSPPLTQFFLECGGLVRTDKKPALCKSYQKLVSDLWHKNRYATLFFTETVVFLWSFGLLPQPGCSQSCFPSLCAVVKAFVKRCCCGLAGTRTSSRPLCSRGSRPSIPCSVAIHSRWVISGPKNTEFQLEMEHPVNRYQSIQCGLCVTVLCVFIQN